MTSLVGNDVSVFVKFDGYNQTSAFNTPTYHYDLSNLSNYEFDLKLICRRVEVATRIETLELDVLHPAKFRRPVFFDGTIRLETFVPHVLAPSTSSFNLLQKIFAYTGDKYNANWIIAFKMYGNFYYANGSDGSFYITGSFVLENLSMNITSTEVSYSLDGSVYRGQIAYRTL